MKVFNFDPADYLTPETFFDYVPFLLGCAKAQIVDARAAATRVSDRVRASDPDGACERMVSACIKSSVVAATSPHRVANSVNLTAASSAA